MKKIFLLFMVLCWIDSYAQNYNSSQENLRTGIESYLRKQGLNTEKQDDGLLFKSEGSTYYVEIDKNEVEPMYVRLRRYVKYDEKLNKDTISKNLNSYNTKYGVKVFYLEKSVVFSAEMYVTQASEFNDVFETLLSHIKSANSLLTE